MHTRRACLSQLRETGPHTKVGGRKMLPVQGIIDNAVISDGHTTLVAAVRAMGPGVRKKLG